MFNNSPPLGYELRCDFIQNWTRFHALPNSKRYAGTNDERKNILTRANALAEECFGKKKSVLLITQDWGEFDLATNDLVREEQMVNVLAWFDEKEEPEDQNTIEFWAKKVDWKHTLFDRYFLGVAAEEYKLVFFDPSTSTVLAPYDGGFDIISFQAELLTLLETKYDDWMSVRPDKL